MLFLGIFIAFLMIALAILSRSITTLIHELGHAIPSLLFTKESVIIYVGSYGDISKSYLLRIGRLSAYLRLNIFDWNIGLCQHSPAKSFFQQLLIILGGPMASLMIAAVLTYIISFGGYSDDWRSLLAIFAISAVWDFFVNIFPADKPMETHDNELVYNDGTQLLRLMNRQQFPDSYYKAMEYKSEKKYKRAAFELENTLKSGQLKREIYQELIMVLLVDKNYYKALEIFEEYRSQHELKAHDHALLGKIQFGIKKYANAIKSYNQAIYFDYNNPDFLSNRGIAYMKMGNEDEAINDFDAAINYGGPSADLYSNRGYAFFRLDEYSAALNDLQAALQLDPQHPDTHMHLGLYYYKRLSFSKALQHFETAKSLDVKHHGLDHYLAELRSGVN